MPAKLQALRVSLLVLLCATTALGIGANSCEQASHSVAVSVLTPLRNFFRDLAHGHLTGLGFRAMHQLYKDLEALNLPPHAKLRLEKIAKRTGFNLSLPDLDLVNDLPIHQRMALFNTLVRMREIRHELNFYGPAAPKETAPPLHFKGQPPETYVLEHTLRAINEYGTGSGGSQLLDGTLSIHNQFAKKISSLLGTEDSMLVSTGDHARVGWVTSMVKEGDHLLVADSSSPVTHDGLLAAANRKISADTFQHNNLQQIWKKISDFFNQPDNRYRNVFIAVPAISYKDGQEANLKALKSFAESFEKKGFSVTVVVDESLALGQIGPSGAGLTTRSNLNYDPHFLITGSLMDNLGVDAGFVSGRASTIKFNKFYMDQHMFSTSLSPTDTSTGMAQVDLLLAGKHLAKPVDIHKTIPEPEIPKFEGPTGRLSTWYTPADGTLVEAISASSNAYLGAQWHAAVKDYTQKFVRTFGNITRTRHAIHDKLSHALAQFFGFEKVVLTRTGFDANLVLRMLPEKGDLVLFDQHSHKSAKDAIKDGELYVPGAAVSSPPNTFYRREFKHNNVEEASGVINDFLKQNPGKKVYLTVESAYSMLGDTMHPDFAKLLDNPNVIFVADEAHGIGVLGPEGKGGLHQLGLSGRPNVIMVGTGSKALGSKFGFIAASKPIADKLEKIFEARYQGLAPVSLANAAAGYAGLKLLEGQPERMQQLHANIARLRKGLYDLGLDVSLTDQGAVVPIKSKSERVNVNQMQRKLETLGANAIRANVAERPAVTGFKILRFSMTADVTPEQIDTIIAEVSKFKRDLQTRN